MRQVLGTLKSVCTMLDSTRGTMMLEDCDIVRYMVHVLGKANKVCFAVEDATWCSVLVALDGVGNG